MIINTQNLEEAKKQIKNAKSPIIVKAQNNEFNRKILEYGKFNILLSLETSKENKDTLKSLDSGLNHVLAKIASKNNISIGIDLNEIRNLDKKEKALRLARIKQNIEICKKVRTKIIFLNSKDKKDSLSLMLSLGASTQQAQNASN